MHSFLKINDFHDFFKNVNTETGHNDDAEPSIFLDQNDDTLSGPFTEDEISKDILKTKNGKAFADDCILNEYLKASAQVMIPI